jgi:type I restriction-modification system DNA methylase subunit
MKSCDLKQVIYLPADMFSNTSIKTCVLYFVKKVEGRDVITINKKKESRKYSFCENH